MSEQKLTAVEQFAIRVASAVTGLGEADFKAALDGIRQPVREIDPLELLAVIIEIVMALIERCPQRAGFVAHVEEPSLLLRIWFRRQIVRPINRNRQAENDVIATTMITEAAKTGQAEREQIYIEITEPDFSVV